MANWSDLSRPNPAWFQDVPFGIFLHWGAYSVPAWAEPIGELGTFDDVYWIKHNPYAEWYANTIRIEDSPAAQHHREVWNDCSYDDFLDAWTAERFEPSAWMDLFDRAGAGYIVPTTKHHDGIALWDAPGTGDRNTVHRGPHRDLIGDLASAARDKGLRVGLYYSGGYDWHFCPQPAIDGRPGHVGSQGREYADYAFDHCIDLIDRYKPDILWNDINWPDEGKGDGPKDLHALFAYHRDAVPEGLVNDRWGVDYWDYRTSEYQAGLELEQSPSWENCRGIGYSFGYNQVEGPEHYLTGAQLARHLVDVVSRGGHFLLNLGPRADGTLEPHQVASLEQLAAWMANARPFVVLPAAGSERPAEVLLPETEAWVRAITQRDGRIAWFIDSLADASNETVVELPGHLEPVCGCTVEHRADSSVLRLASDRQGPAVAIG